MDNFTLDSLDMASEIIIKSEPDTDDGQDEKEVLLQGLTTETTKAEDLEGDHVGRTMSCFACNQCGIQFEHNWQFVLHLKSVHSTKSPKTPLNKENSTSRNQVDCQSCERTFQSTLLLQQHELAHQTNGVKNSSEPGLPLVHERTLSSDECQTQSTEVDNIGLSLYSCEVCGNFYQTLESYNIHVSTCHRSYYPPANDSMLLCEYCGDIFKSSATLQKHLSGQHNVQLTKFKKKHPINLFPGEETQLSLVSSISEPPTKPKKSTSDFEEEWSVKLFKCEKCVEVFESLLDCFEHQTKCQ